GLLGSAQFGIGPSGFVIEKVNSLQRYTKSVCDLACHLLRLTDGRLEYITTRLVEVGVFPGDRRELGVFLSGNGRHDGPQLVKRIALDAKVVSRCRGLCQHPATDLARNSRQADVAFWHPDLVEGSD